MKFEKKKKSPKYPRGQKEITGEKNKTKSWFFEGSTNHQTLLNQTGHEKRKNVQITKIMNERGDISTVVTETKRIDFKEYHE